ncbi:MAG: DUF4954 family protein [Bacteroidales bacterium]|uniref:DUF4954 family protein n=1 Tax=Candidatus Cryptobacteroides sp. TaxID=2952915 RepID=UPI002A7631FB|nr:DUF4954 family protein [Candidatus Cryptobacteroides sp.]MDD7233919.1 DUF4954 family protein [Bacteroidales bacterium]MDY2701029.1 DUF4954 family protein [Candidatus Cryptobacteroides sp.]
MKTFMKLTAEQIAVLEAQSCRCENWSEVTVAEDFNPKYVRNVNFSGQVRLGSFNKIFTLAGGIRKHSGIYHATLHNVIVGDDCMVEHIRNYIANYIIGDGSYIENVTDLITYGETSFGNGTKVSVLNETGGREVAIHEHLSSHEAYITALYRHDQKLIDSINELVSKYVESSKSTFGVIGKNVEILDAMHIVNVKIGDSAKIKGASRLRNGSIVSCEEAPVNIGMNVIADDFIVESGSSITDGVTLTRCFVGQACVLGHGYSASDSLFFSNCQGENGEACALFAGPYTVTHHKSTLLIAGMFSFMNAGSGSNQSNHMYKLGPIHQGIFERGAKTTSDSYVLYPAKIGAFSLVMGRHVNNPDTSNLPFSYLIEQQGVTYIIPGVNLKSVGTVRDVRKWPSRDRRKDPHRLDHINFNHLSPFTVQKMFEGIRILEMLKEASGNRADNYYYKKSIIRNASLHKGLKYYQTGIIKFLGNSFITRIQDADVSSDEGLRQALRRDNPVGAGHWLDISGLICPASEIEKLCDDLTEGKVRDLVELGSRFGQIASDYYSYEWTWAYDAIEKFWGYDLANITRSQAIDLISQWKNAVISLDKLIYDDAGKEFELTSMTGFGVDGDKVRRDADFTAVRGGGFNENPFVLEVLDHMRRKGELGDRMIARLGRKK